MEEKEIFKDIEGFEGYYQVSNMNRVKSLERTVWCGLNGGYYKTVHERILKPSKTNMGYLQVMLCKDGKRKWYRIHRLVATAFCENPEGYTDVNHINEDKSDNRAENLEWCSRSYNNSYNDKSKKAGKKVAEKLRNYPKTSKPIIGIDKVTGLTVEFPSAKEASRQIGINQSNITSCLKGRQKTCGGFYWMYSNNNDADAE